MLDYLCQEYKLLWIKWGLASEPLLSWYEAKARSVEATALVTQDLGRLLPNQQNMAAWEKIDAK